MGAELKVFKSSDCEWRKCRSTNSQRSRSNDDDQSDDATEYYDSVAGTQDVQAHAALSQNANGSVTNDCNHDHDNGGLVDHTCSSQRRCRAEPSESCNSSRRGISKKNHVHVVITTWKSIEK